MLIEVKSLIIQLGGKVNFPITLDASVWIFDDRKILFEEAFTQKKETKEDDSLKRAAERFNQEIYQQKINPPINKSINKFEREKILKNTYVMPIKSFVESAEFKDDAKSVLLTTSKGDVEISLEQLLNSYLLFADKGKPLADEGPVHLYFTDGSNRDKPIKGIKKITVI